MSSPGHWSNPVGTRSVRCGAQICIPGDRVLVLGPGTIGLLAGMFALAQGAEVHLMGVLDRSLAFARTLDFHGAWSSDQLPSLPWDAVIDCI